MAEDQKIDFEPIDFQEEKPSEEPIQFEPIDFQEEAAPEPVDVAKEEATGYSMDKFLSDTGDVLGRVASIPKDLINLPSAVREAYNAPMSKQYTAAQGDIDAEIARMRRDEPGAPELQMPDTEGRIRQKLIDRQISQDRAKAAGLAPAISQNLNALVEKGIAKANVYNPFSDMTDEAYQDLYGNRDIKDIAEQNRAMQEKSTADFPLTSMGSKMLTTTALAAPAIAAAPAALAVAAPTAAYGTLGAIESGEKTYNETGSAGEALREGVKTLATQGVADAATMGLARAAKSGLQSLKKVPASQTLKSIGAKADDIAALETKSTNKSPEAIAKQLEESGVVRAMRSKASAASKLDEVITKESDKLAEAVKQVSNQVDPQYMGTVVDDIARTAERDILGWLAKEKGIVDPDNPIVKDITSKIRELRNIGDDNILTNRKNPTFEQINNKRKDFGKAKRSWEQGRTDVHQQALEKLYFITRDGLNLVADSVDNPAGYRQQTDKVAKLLAAKQLTGISKEPGIIKPAGDRGLQGSLVAGLRQYGLPGTLLATGAATIGLPATAAVALPVWAIGKYGRSTLAAGARGAEKTLNFGAQNAAKALEVAKTRFPEVYNKFASAIEAAASRGEAAVSATNYMLSQQFPEYREMIENSKDAEDLPVEPTDEDLNNK